NAETQQDSDACAPNEEADAPFGSGNTVRDICQGSFFCRRTMTVLAISGLYADRALSAAEAMIVSGSAGSTAMETKEVYAPNPSFCVSHVFPPSLLSA